MRSTREWGNEVFAALVPLLLGAVAIFLFQGNGAGQAIVRWVSEGTLMPAAVLICFAIYRRVGHFPKGKARTVCERAIIVYTGIILLLFGASIQPGTRQHSQTEFAIYNATAYFGVILFCAIVGGHRSGEVNQ